MAWLDRAAVPVLAVTVLLAVGCRTTDTGDGPRVEADSLVVDLFSLGARLRLRADNVRLTPLGAAFLSDTLPSIRGEDVVLALDRRVRNFSAYVRHDLDLACHPDYAGKGSLLIQLDDGMESHCHDTLYAWVPSYPYRKPLSAAHLQGVGFWIAAGEVPFARGALIVHYDYFPGEFP